jgi:hypothetical protein
MKKLNCFSELLPQTKHTLSLDAKALQASSSSALLDQLARVSANAEIIHGLKRLSGQAWIDVADELDREGERFVPFGRTPLNVP